MKLKGFFIAKESHQKEQITYRMGKKILSYYISDRELIARIYKELQKLNTKRGKSHPINKCAYIIKSIFKSSRKNHKCSINT